MRQDAPYSRNYQQKVQFFTNSIQHAIFYTADTRKKVMESGVIEVITQVVRVHMKNADICKIGCKVIWNILMKGKALISTTQST